MNRTEDDFRISEIVDEFTSRVFSTAFNFVKNREDAEDITQEVFIEIYESFNRFENRSLLSTWIYRITISKCIDFIRKRSRKKRFGSIKKILTFDRIKNIVEDRDINPEREFLMNERANILNSAIEKLNDKQKTVIILKYREEMTQKEIADIMNTTDSAVESLIHRGRKNIEKELFRYYERKK